MAQQARESLEQHLRHSRFEPREAVEIIRALAVAMGSAHATGILHRDLKPANVLLSDGVPKLTDFGLAQRIDDERITVSGSIMGTPSYMSP
ncbi:MAG: protein kinase, partial [bacterium]|nr:protein kinase [bacterium]